MIDLSPTEEQKEIQTLARRFAREVIRPAETALSGRNWGGSDSTR
jgi:hypothetical protein